VDWIKLARGRVQWQAVVILISRRVPQMQGISWPVEQVIARQKTERLVSSLWY
jgi:hypothetical protein